MNYLLIPDGLRRYARREERSYAANYAAGGRKMFSDVERLATSFSIVGAFPLAKYNLSRPANEVHALLEGLCDSFADYLSRTTRRVVVIGDDSFLVDRHPPFADLLARCQVNPHLHGRLSTANGSLVLYLCYDGARYARELIERYDDLSLQDGLPQWTFVFRTGCEHAYFRYSALILGADQARLACTDKLFQETNLDDMLQPFRAWLA